jgi:hypothetical protein
MVASRFCLPLLSLAAAKQRRREEHETLPVIRCDGRADPACLSDPVYYFKTAKDHEK